MIILELSDIQLTKQANSAGLLRWQACRKIEVTQGPSRTGSFSHSTQLVNSGGNRGIWKIKIRFRSLALEFLDAAHQLVHQAFLFLLQRVLQLNFFGTELVEFPGEVVG